MSRQRSRDHVKSGSRFSGFDGLRVGDAGFLEWQALLEHLIAVSWPYSAIEAGMPSAQDKEQMDLLEDLLAPALEEPRNALLTVVATGNGVREWQWYSTSPEKTMELVNQKLQGRSPFPVEFSIESDPDWAAYSQFES